jgi:hypothetical protein
MYKANTSASRIVNAPDISLVALDVRSVGVLSGNALRDLASTFMSFISFRITRGNNLGTVGAAMFELTDRFLLEECQQIGVDLVL